MKNLETELNFSGLDFSKDQENSIFVYLSTLYGIDAPTGDHSLRIANMSKKIHLIPKLTREELYFACIVHDIGKIQISPKALKASHDKDIVFKKKYQKEMKKHVLFSYELLKDYSDFYAGVALYHHRYQDKPYPSLRKIKKINKLYPEEQLDKIISTAKIISVLDFYEAIHNRDNGNNEFDKSKGIEELMIEKRPYSTDLIKCLFEEKVFEELSN